MTRLALLALAVALALPSLADAGTRKRLDDLEARVDAIEPTDPRAIATRLAKVPAFIAANVDGVRADRSGDAYIVATPKQWAESHRTWGDVMRVTDHAHHAAGYGVHGPVYLRFVTSDRIVTTALDDIHECRNFGDMSDEERGECLMRVSRWRERGGE